MILPDLPTGQLAEATITDFDENGTPNAGTIQIDHDANGVGWFIDPTPWENSEFAVGSRGAGEAEGTGEETYLLAAAESEANGKYDLLTTVLHELAHLYGFIEDQYQPTSNRYCTDAKFCASSRYRFPPQHPINLDGNSFRYPSRFGIPRIFNRGAIRSVETYINRGMTGFC